MRLPCYIVFVPHSEAVSRIVAPSAAWLWCARVYQLDNKTLLASGPQWLGILHRIAVKDSLPTRL